MVTDLAIINGTIVDGTGRAAFSGDVHIRDGRIAAITAAGQPAPAAAKVIDAQGLMVAPGFIDFHSHSDFLLPLPNHPELMQCLLEQGCTTIVGGNCGFSPAPLGPEARERDILDSACLLLAGRTLPYAWGSMDAFLSTLEERGTLVNLIELEGHGLTRAALLGMDGAYPGAEGMRLLKQRVDESVRDGAFGLSLGLGYAPGLFVENRELEELAEVVQRHDGLLAVHTKALSKMSPAYDRNPFGEPHNLRALKEMIALAEKTGVRLQISHLIFVGKKSWPTCDRALELINEAQSRGVDIAFDSYPQMAGNTTILVIYPDWFLLDREKNLRNRAALLRLHLEWTLGFWALGFGLEDIQLLWAGHPDHEELNGLFFPEIARRIGCSARRAYLELSRASQGRATVLIHKYSGDDSFQEPLLKVLSHPLNLFMTDAIISPQGAPNPGAYGTFPRIIQMMVRETGLLSLEETVARMTGRSARRMGIADRGTLTEGSWADVTVFDADGVRDNTTPDDTRARPSGIAHVLINGRPVVRDGSALPGAVHGRVIRRA